MSEIYQRGRKQSGTVLTTVMCLFGPSNWATYDTTNAPQRTVSIKNNGSATLYINVIDQTKDIAGTVSATVNIGAITPGQIWTDVVCQGEIVVLVSDGVCNVTAKETNHA